jgi:hypothetical protein
MKPEETQRDSESWYGRIKSGQIRCCPVEGCGGKLVHDDMVTWYSCEKCEWNDEFQDIQDYGWQEPKKGWPRIARTCVVCGASNDGTSMPMIEQIQCSVHPKGHVVCRWKMDDHKHMVKCECSASMIYRAVEKKCTIDLAQKR